MADQSLPYSRIRQSTPPELVQLLRTSTLSTDAITHHLLHGVATGSLQPIHFTIWLQFCKSPAAIRLALAHADSRAVRQAGIKQLGRHLASARWRETWDELGGTDGIQDVLRGLPVVEIKQFVSVVVRAVRGADDAGEEEEKKKKEKRQKQQAVFQLARALLPALSLPASISSSDDEGTAAATAAAARDERPVAGFYEPLLQAIPPDAVAALLSQSLSAGGDSADAKAQLSLAQRYPSVVQTAIFAPIFSRSDDGAAQVSKMKPALTALLHGRISTERSTSEPNFSGSMHFSLSLLRRLAAAAEAGHKTLFPPAMFLPDLVEPLLRRCCRRRAAVRWRRVLEIVRLAARYLACHPEAAAASNGGLALPRGRGSFPAGKEPLLVAWTVRLWARHPDECDDVVRALVRLAVPEGDRAHRSVSMFALDYVAAAARRYEFLRLCCQEVGWGDVDVDADLAERMPTRGWDMALFRWLPTEDAWKLFERARRCVDGFAKQVDVDRLRLELLKRRGEKEQVVELVTKRKLF